jgi:hypothetical protein
MENNKKVQDEWTEVPNSNPDEIPPPPRGRAVTFIGLLPSGAVIQSPTRLIEGAPLFWSSDNRGIYYYSGSGSLQYVDIETKKSKPVLKITPQNLLGRVPGMDAVFVFIFNRVDFVTLKSDITIDPELVRAVKELNTVDADGDALASLEPVGNRRLFVKYINRFGQFHVQLLEY